MTEAVARQLEVDLLTELSNVLATEHGPVPPELAEARAAWPDDDVGGTLVLDARLVKLAAGDSRARPPGDRYCPPRPGGGQRDDPDRGTARWPPRHGRAPGAIPDHPRPVSPELGRRAGELLGATGLPGIRSSVDAVVAATALERERPVVLLTSDPGDLSRLVEEPGRPKAQRITVVHV